MYGSDEGKEDATCLPLYYENMPLICIIEICHFHDYVSLTFISDIIHYPFILMTSVVPCWSCSIIAPNLTYLYFLIIVKSVFVIFIMLYCVQNILNYIEIFNLCVLQIELGIYKDILHNFFKFLDIVLSFRFL